MTTGFLPLLSLAFLALAAPAAALGEKDDAIRVLIVDGFGNHDWKASTRDILGLLKRAPLVQARVSTVPSSGRPGWETWLPDFSSCDVVIQTTNDIGGRGAWPEPARKALESHIASGGGMLVFHSANNAFPQWREYNLMIGLGWRDRDFGPAIRIVSGKPVTIPPGVGERTSHGHRADTLVTRLGNHPIHRNLPPKWMAADLEIYRYARGPARHLTVLSYAKDPKTGLNFPIEWVVSYGKGRVHNSTYGHHWHNQKEPPPGIRCVAFQTIFNRAIHWLARRPVDASVPDNFPSERQISLAD